MFDWIKQLFETKEETKKRLFAEAKSLYIQTENARIEWAKQEAKDRARAKVQALKEARERKIIKLKAAKARKELLDKIKAAKKLVKEKGLKRTRRNGQTVYVNKDGDIVNYMLLYYLLFHTNNETYGRNSDYSTPILNNAQEASSSDWSGTFSGGESGGGGASSSWSDDSSSSSSSDFGGSFGGGSDSSSGASGSW